MAKQALKYAKGVTEQPELVDVDRIVPKASGGTYSTQNYRVLSPRAHMQRHGTLREREPLMEQLKTAVDDRRQFMKLSMKINNQLLAYKRQTDELNHATVAFLEEQNKQVSNKLKDHDRIIARLVKDIAKTGGIAKAALGVKGVGPMTVAHMLVYVDIYKARHASSLWAYAGLDKPSHERYEKGVAGGGNKTLRTALYTLADSQIKTRGPYREVYDRVKARLEISDKVTKSRNTQGKLIECAWKDTKPSHRHGAAIRKIIKAFLADWWYVEREMNGLDTSPLYAEAMLGKGHKTIDPRSNGWEW